MSKKKIETINIIGDIGGRFDEFMLLLNKMPEADLILAVGDLPDRGPKTREVIQWFMDNTHKAEALYGNHDDMMAFNSPWWINNGGWASLESYPEEKVLPEHLEWLKKRPLYYKAEGLVVTHAPITQIVQLPKNVLACDNPKMDYEGSFIWRRGMPMKPIRGYFFVHGHNWKLREYQYGHKDNTYGVCIDNTGAKELCGLHWTGDKKDYKIFSQSFLT